MANYSPNDILPMVQPFVKNVPVTAMQYIAFDTIHSIVWTAYPWRWTRAALTAIALVDGTQDYTVANADFFRLLDARITRTDLTPNRYQELTLLEFIPPELNIKTQWGNFRNIAPYYPTSSTIKLRLETAAGIGSGMTLQIDGAYQITPTKITVSNWSTPLASPDWYAQVFVDGLLWWFYKFADDDRAGTVSINRDGSRQYTGQLAKFYDALDDMRMKEDELNGTAYVFPADGLGPSFTGRILSIYGQ